MLSQRTAGCPYDTPANFCTHKISGSVHHTLASKRTQKLGLNHNKAWHTEAQLPVLYSSCRGSNLQSADLPAYPSMTKGRSNNTPFTSGAAQDMQLESSSPLPPPTSMMHLAPCHAYASFKVCVPPCKLCCVKYVMDCINSPPKAAFSDLSPYCNKAPQ